MLTHERCAEKRDNTTPTKLDLKILKTAIFFVWHYFTKTPTCLTKLLIVAGTIFASADHYLCTYVEKYWIRHFPWVYAPCLHITVVLLCCDKIQYFLAPFIRKGLLVAETLRTTNTRPFSRRAKSSLCGQTAVSWADAVNLIGSFSQTKIAIGHVSQFTTLPVRAGPKCF